MDQNRAPLIEALQKYVSDGAIAFHTPGHKQGKGVDAAIRKMVTPLGLKMDVSLMKELDDLFAPTGCLKEAQALAAQLYGADESIFVINGTTGAIHIMLFSILKPGDKIIVPRNAHKSVLGAIVLCGAEPIFVEPMINDRLGIAMSVRKEDIEKAIKENTDAKAVLLVYPTYYGVACDIKEISSLVHDHNMALLVDEAHGPHLKFSEKLPVQALDAGADMTAQSTHKILSSFTQTSLLHVHYGRVQPQRVYMANSLLQSTSPNYLLMASLDAARRQMAQKGKELIGRAVNLANGLRKQINRITGLYCFGEEISNNDDFYALDYTKLTVNFRGLGITGYEAEQLLRYKHKIQCELADMYNVLFIISLADSEKEGYVLYEALLSLAKSCSSRQIKSTAIKMPSLPTQKILPRKAVFAKYKTIDFKESSGCICAEAITFYPPGIPIIYPGEVISKDIIDYIKEGQQAGAKITGPADLTLQTIRVIK